MTYTTDTKLISPPHGSLFQRVRRLFNAYQKRRDFRKLLDLDDHMLTDMGVTRAEVRLAAQRPIWVDAGAELHQMALDRRRARM